MSRPRNIKQVCEVCFKREANSLTHNREDDKWYFCCSACLIDGYEIAFSRLTELDWYEHMMRKGWVHCPSFIPRFSWALNQVKGVSQDELWKRQGRQEVQEGEKEVGAQPRRGE